MKQTNDIHTIQRRAAKLILEDGSEFSGWSFGKARSQAGEAVFTSAMTGFPLTLTDPGYRGQILVSAYPIITDCPVPVNPKTGETALDQFGLPDELESSSLQIAGFVVSEICEDPQAGAGQMSGKDMQTLSSWLDKSGIPGIYGIDTRAIVLRLRNQGVMRAKILVDGSRDVTLDSGIVSNPVEEVSVKEAVNYGPAAGGSKKAEPLKIALIDCGVKAGAIRCLLNRNARVIRLPWNHDLKDIDFDGLVLSGGPGDPKACGRTIATVRRAFDLKKPIFGIGLGAAIMAMAAGADIYKLPYGHRGCSQPCHEQGTERCYVTTQNHGYAIRAESMPKGWDTWFINANDNSIEGIKSNRYPFSAVMFQPEACPGPKDTEFLFDRFLTQVKDAKK
ncbi:MAG: glutamine-hydrolyzing carbamoyl-phosphate synthase small subunit [Treponema sp.]|nr:glutamine-hydrolyzing carbamoyl-phosphate synthase small subunit [Treponema sp.]